MGLAAFGDSTLARADPAPPSAAGLGSTDTGPAAVVVAFDSVWVANAATLSFSGSSPLTFEEGPIREVGVGSTPTGLAAGEGAVWVANTGDDYVTRIDAAGLGANALRAIPVGDGPTDVAIDHGIVWVANAAAGSISRIDPGDERGHRHDPGGQSARRPGCGRRVGLGLGSGSVGVSP